MSSTLDRFRERLTTLYKAWHARNIPGFSDTQAFALATGVYDSDTDIGYSKSFTVITWLFSTELQGCAVFMSDTHIVLVISPADLSTYTSYASTAPADPLPPISVVSVKSPDAAAAAIIKTLGLDASPTLAAVPKDLNAQQGPTVKLITAVSEKHENMAPAIAAVLAPKDDTEENHFKKAAVLTCHVMKHTLTDKIEKTIDQDRKISHTSLSEMAEDAIANPSKERIPGYRTELCDPCYPPIVQSADISTKKRTFDLRPSAESDENNLAHGCIIVSLGARYNFYCSNLSRTLFIAPSKNQEIVYSIAIKAQEVAISALVPGAHLKDAYTSALQSVKNDVKNYENDPVIKLPDLVKSFTKNVGYATGIEFRDAALVLNAKNNNPVKERQVFYVTIGFANLSDDANGTYSVLIGDSVFIHPVDKGGAEIYTNSSRKDFKHISYALSADDDDDGPRANGSGKSNASSKRKTRGAENGGDDDAIDVDDALMNAPRGRRRQVNEGGVQEAEVDEEQRRKKHQEALAKKMLDRGMSRLKGGTILTMDDAKQSQKTLLDEFRAYDTPRQMPSLKPKCIIVDMDREAIIVPINGIPVPFHISTLKNATKSDEGQYSYLRVNFHTPEATVSRGVGRPDNSPKFPGFAVDEGNCASFIKEFTFRSSNPMNLNESLRKIKELRKRATEKATHAREKETLVEQQSLVIERGRSNLSLSDVSIRPPMAKGKNNVGTLEAHQNGFRYRCRSGTVDIIYANIRNAFFQEADKELLVLVHFHLKNEIMIGTKKAKDVQFYVQVTEAVVKLNEGRRRQFDQDELEEEQRERELKNRTNKSFLKFTKDVEERYDLEFDVPYRQLQFSGAPKSISVTLLPTVSCVVNLTEWPPFVLNLQDVEVAHFERVDFQLRMFDLVFVLKGFEDDPAATGKNAKDCWLRISSIPVEELTPLKRYLDEQNLKYYEGKASLHWNDVLKNIRSDLEEFYEQGGWNFLSDDASDDDASDGDDGEEESMDGDAAFEPDSDVEDDDDSGSSDSDSDGGGSDAAAELEGESDEGEDELDSEEEGASWEEMERQAHRDDMRKGKYADDDEGDRRTKRKGASESSRRRAPAPPAKRSGGGRKRGRRD